MHNQAIPLLSGGSLQNSFQPVFIRLPKSGTRCPLTGLSRSALNGLILPTPANNYRPPVQSKILKQNRHATRGIRLVMVSSLLAHLAHLAEQN